MLNPRNSAPWLDKINASGSAQQEANFLTSVEGMWPSQNKSAAVSSPSPSPLVEKKNLLREWGARGDMDTHNNNMRRIYRWARGLQDSDTLLLRWKYIYQE